MSYSIFGQVVGVRKYVNGDMEIDFFHDEEITEFNFSQNSNPNTLPRDLIDSMAATLATDICIEIFFDDSNLPTHIEFEECDYGEEDDQIS